MQQEIIIAFMIWLLFWVFIWYYYAKREIIIFSKFEMRHFEKMVSIAFTLAWFWMHVYWFFNDIDVAIMFDIVWMGAMAHLIWLDIWTLLDKYFKKWNK